MGFTNSCYMDDLAFVLLSALDIHVDTENIGWDADGTKDLQYSLNTIYVAWKYISMPWLPHIYISPLTQAKKKD